MAITPKPRRLKSGQVVWDVQFRPTPGSSPTREVFDTLPAAKQFVTLIDRVGGAAARAARDMATMSGTSVPTLNTAIDQHLDELRASVTAGTIRRYQQIANTRLRPTLGDLPCDLITRPVVTQWLAKQRETPVQRGRTKGSTPSYKTLRGAQALLSSVLEHQVRAGTIPTNVARGLKLPRDGIVRDKVFLTPTQFATLLDCVPDAHKPLVSTLYGLGLRFGEATALTPADLDLDAAQPVVRVTKAWKEGKKGSYLGSPKTRRSIRTVTVPPSLIPILREQARKKKPGALLFPNTYGEQITSGAFHARVWQPAVAASGLDPAPRVHDLRHSHASALIAAGIPLPVIQRRLGHESIQTTVDVYGHLAPEAYAGAASAIDLSLTQALPKVESEAAPDEIVGEVLEERQIEAPDVAQQ